MTNKFDPNATPECDALLLDYADVKAWIALAGYQETKARRAEEKLRIAVEALRHIKAYCPHEDTFIFTDKTISEIEKVDK
jgi:hypothetical protein